MGNSRERRMLIFVLSGQSNMSGRGGVKGGRWDGVVPPQCAANPCIRRFSAGRRWEEAHEPLHADIDTTKTCGVGPGMAFANAVLPALKEAASAAEEVVVGLVPCAIGGTPIKEWEKGSKLYEAMVRRAKEAAEAGGELAAVLWYQGESDTDSEQAAESYKTNMERLIGNVRSDLHSPSLPFIQVALASGNKKFIEKVRDAQLGIHLPNVVCVDAKGMPLNDDHLHLTTEAQVSLGNMLANAYNKNFLIPPCV